MILKIWKYSFILSIIFIVLANYVDSEYFVGLVTIFVFGSLMFFFITFGMALVQWGAKGFWNDINK
jgi:hypothetical protein